MKFDEFDLDPRCLSVLNQMEIETPTPIQEAAIPVALQGTDVLATAQTGTGKTLGFVLPALSRLAQEKPRRNRMLVLAPTRELCIQVESVVNVFARALKLSSMLIYGGVGFGKQNAQLKSGCDIIVATPGRLLDHMGRGSLRFNDLETLVIDEADRMLDMGFLPDIRQILRHLPKERQTMFFSATFAPALESLASEMLHEPERIMAGAVSCPVDTVKQVLYPVRTEEKSGLLLKLLKETEVEAAVIFLRTKERTDRLAKTLKKSGYKATALHGDLPQQRRQRALTGFREGRYNILVATDVAARGLDIDEISHVFNYDIPPTADDYVHRVGRTARAQREGHAVTFVTPTDFNALGTIEKAVGRNLPRETYPGAPRILSIWSPPGARKKSSGRGRTGKRMLRRR